MTLKEELDARRAEFMRTAPAARIEAYQRSVDELAARDLVAKAVKTGERAPDFELRNARGEVVRLSRLVAGGPVVLTFYRGGWCPYCNLQLRAYQRALPLFRALGAVLVAVSPEAPDQTLSTAQKNALEFEVLSDVNGEAGRAFRLFFDLSAELRSFYVGGGIDLSEKHADGEWRLPVPATYVIAADGRVALAFVDPEYRNRLEPSQIVRALETLRQPACNEVAQSLTNGAYRQGAGASGGKPC